MRKTNMKGVTVLLAAAMLLAGCCGKYDNRVKAPTRVKTRIMTTTRDFGGQTYVGVVEEREATAVSFTGMGVVKRVLVSEGQTVSRGQLIAEMDDAQARNVLSGAEAQMTQANDALQRYRILHDNGSLPEVQWVEIQSKVAQAKAQLEVARKNLSDCRLTAPVSGVVGRQMVHTGETALPSQAVVTILDVSSVKVKVSVPEDEVSRIGVNTPSKVQVDAIGCSYSGGRIEKGVTADALTHTYDVRIHVVNTERRLLPGMVASVSIAAPELRPVGGLAVPVTSVQKRADGSMFVWTVDRNGIARRTTVVIGETCGNSIVLTEGVREGQRIVVEGCQKLSEGTKVVF